MEPVKEQAIQHPAKASPKDVFLQLLSIITLYCSAAALIDLLFNFINLAFPDSLNGAYFGDSAQGSARFDVSVLIIVFPAYLIVNWLLTKDYVVDPEKRNLRVRKWLVYLTLFLSALFLIGDLVTLVNNLLQGDLAAPFLLKVLSVFVVIGGIFFYYFWDIRKHKTE
jgi:hypothetical protein